MTKDPADTLKEITALADKAAGQATELNDLLRELAELLRQERTDP